MAAGSRSVIFWIVSVWSQSSFRHQLLCYEGSPLCIRCVSACLSQICLCVCVNECLKWVRIFLDHRCWFTLRGGFGPRGRRFRCCQRFLWRSSVVRTPHALLPSAVSWLPVAACPRPSPRSCPCPPTAWALTASLAQTLEAACFHPEEIKSEKRRDKVRCWKQNIKWRYQQMKSQNVCHRFRCRFSLWPLVSTSNKT